MAHAYVASSQLASEADGRETSSRPSAATLKAKYTDNWFNNRIKFALRVAAIVPCKTDIPVKPDEPVAYQNNLGNHES